MPAAVRNDVELTIATPENILQRRDARCLSAWFGRAIVLPKSAAQKTVFQMAAEWKERLRNVVSGQATMPTHHAIRPERPM
jgi:hypothetical protein